MLNKWKRLLINLTAATQLLLPACKTSLHSTYENLEDGIKRVEAELRRSAEERKLEEKEEYFFIPESQPAYSGPNVAAMPFDNPLSNIGILRSELGSNRFGSYFEPTKKERRGAIQRRKILEEHQRRLDNPDYKPSDSKADLKDVYGALKGELLPKHLRKDLESEVERFLEWIPIIGPVARFGYRGFKKVTGFVTNSLGDAVNELGIRHYDDDLNLNLTQDRFYFGATILFTPTHSLNIYGDFDKEDRKKSEERLVAQFGIKF